MTVVLRDQGGLKANSRKHKFSSFLMIRQHIGVCENSSHYKRVEFKLVMSEQSSSAYEQKRVNRPVKMRIAVVEDYEPLRNELMVLLELAGFDVYGFESGESLLSALLQCSFDVALLDLNLPGKNGLSIASHLRDCYSDIRIIILTGRAHDDDHQKGYAAGADVYLTKPQHPKELLAVIRSMSPP